MVRKKYFRPYKTQNCGISKDRTQHILWRSGNLSVPPAAKYDVVDCGPKNLDHDEAKVSQPKFSEQKSF